MLSIDLFDQKLPNPLFIASGIFGYGTEYSFIDYKNIAGFCTKGISLKPKTGNIVPRIAETEFGMLNSIGLQNIGLEVFINKCLPELVNLNKKIIVNYFGNTFDEYYELSEKLSILENIFALEINISCPNVKEGCLSFGQDPKTVFKLISEVKKRIKKKPLIVKLTPNVTDIVSIAKASEDGGADGLSLINTLKGMKIDINKKKPVLGVGIGGFSGPSIKPVALRCVYEVYQNVSIPIIGIGGISNAEDVLEFIMAGSRSIQIGSILFNDPNICTKIINDLFIYLTNNKIKNITDIVGVANLI